MTEVNEELISDFNNLFETKEGKALLKLSIIDPLDNLKVDMISRSIRVKLSNKLIDYIKSNPEIELTVN